MRTTGFFWAAGLLGAVMTCAVGTKPPDRASQTVDPAVLTSSEMEYTESGGLMGRTQQVRYVAKGGRVEVEYRPAGRPQDPVLRGMLEADRYMEFWREAERIGIWTMSTPPKSAGADMVESELRVRLPTKSHAVRWQIGAPGAPALTSAAELGRRMLAAAREVTLER